MSTLIHKVQFHISTHDLEKVHDWVVNRFGTAWNGPVDAYNIWCWGYTDSGYLNLSFAKEEDAAETILYWK